MLREEMCSPSEDRMGTESDGEDTARDGNKMATIWIISRMVALRKLNLATIESEALVTELETSYHPLNY